MIIAEILQMQGSSFDGRAQTLRAERSETEFTRNYKKKQAHDRAVCKGVDSCDNHTPRHEIKFRLLQLRGAKGWQ
jgi:phosphoribosylformylglycinamidine (FGAM) synthase-like amidotransferase family enzyme